MNAISGYIDSTYGIEAFELGFDSFQQENRNPQGRDAAKSSSFVETLQDTLTLSPEAQVKALGMSSREGVVHGHQEVSRYAQYDEPVLTYDVQGMLNGETVHTPNSEELRRFAHGNQSDMASVVAVYGQNVLPMPLPQNSGAFTPGSSRLHINGASFSSTNYGTSGTMSSGVIGSMRPEQVASAYKTQANNAYRDTLLSPTGSWSLGIHIKV